MLGFVALFLLGVFLLWLYALIACLTRPGVDSGLRIVWFLVIFFLPLFGPLLFIFVGPKANSAKTIVVTNNTTGTISESTSISAKGMSTGGKVAIVCGCIFMLLVIGIPVASIIAVRTFGSIPGQQVTKTFSKTQTFDLSGKKTGTPAKDIKSFVRNLATAQEANYVDQGVYTSCFGILCAMSLPGITLGDGQYAEVTAFRKGSEDGFIIKAWNLDDPSNKVVWDSTNGGMQ